MGMYDDIVENVSENIEINGYPFFAENITADEPYNRREYEFKPILNGTEEVKRGKYIHREFSFTTLIYHPTGEPDTYDKILEEIMSKPAEVISPYMGGKFNAIVVFSKNFEEGSPNHYSLDVTVTEVPDKISRIPGESKLVVPDITKVSIKKSSNNKVLSNTDKKLNTQLSKCNVPFRKNQKNNCVKLLQEKLISLGFLNKKNKTGKYDIKTINAVKAYQRSKKLKVDGIFGKYTLNSIIKK